MTIFPLRAAIVGCGRIAGLNEADSLIQAAYDPATHAGAYQRHPQVDFVGACDPREAARVAFGKIWKGVSIYAGLDQLLATDEPEIVSVAIPYSNRLEVFEKLVQAKSVRLIFCEKPLSDTAKQAKHFVSLCYQAQIKLVVNYIRRFDTSHAKARMLITNNRIGTVQGVQITYSDGIYTTGSHMLDLANWFFGPIRAVRAFGSKKSREGDPVIDGLLETRSGVRVHLAGIGGCTVKLCTFDVYGSAGRLLIDGSGFRLRIFDVVSHPRATGRYELGEKGSEISPGLSTAMLSAVDNCLAALNEDKVPACSGEDGLRVQYLIDALEESLTQNGKRITIENGD